MEKLILLSILVDQGYRIGDLADRPNKELRLLTEVFDHAHPKEIIPNPSFERALTAIKGFDDISLWSELERATSVYGRLDLIDSFVFPLIHRVKDLVGTNELVEVHLFFLRTTLRTFLSTLLAPITGDPQKPVVVFAYPPGQSWDLGGIASAVHIHAAGWHPVILGSAIPAEQVVSITVQLNARAIILSAETDTYDTTVLNEVVRVRRSISSEVVVFFGGHVPERLLKDILSGGLVLLRNMADLRQQLENNARGMQAPEFR